MFDLGLRSSAEANEVCGCMSEVQFFHTRASGSRSWCDESDKSRLFEEIETFSYYQLNNN